MRILCIRFKCHFLTDLTSNVLTALFPILTYPAAGELHREYHLLVGCHWSSLHLEASSLGGDETAGSLAYIYC
jgi:hypothetical protein